jgi:phage gpG-like protein
MVVATVDTSDLDDMARRYAGLVPLMEREFRVAMIRSTAQVQHDAQVAVAVDQGTLRRSITTDVTPYVGRVGTNLLYGRLVEGADEQGKLHEWSRRPGMPMPPPGSLVGWMRRHGMNPKNEYALRLQISRKGIKARPYLTPALEKNRAGINKEFTLALGRVLSALGRGA